MPYPLPMLQARAAQTRTCTYCPKLCQPACPVSTVEGNETVTPWGKMRAMGELSQEPLGPRDSSRAQLAWACTQCLHCRSLCLLDNPVADTLSEARAELYESGQAPETVKNFVARWPARVELLRALSAEHKLSSVSSQSAPVVFLPGCTRVKFQGETLGSLARAVSVLTAAVWPGPGADLSVLAGRCCGAPLHDAGDRAGFAAHARGFARELKGASRVVAADAGCAFTLRKTYGLYGIALPKVEHIAETARAAIDRLGTVVDSRRVRYHDACKLGRGLGVYDPPRKVLKALRGESPEEMPGTRERSECSGGGGLLPITRRASAEAIADELAEATGASGNASVVVVTACATTRRRLARRGVAAEDLADWIARGCT